MERRRFSGEEKAEIWRRVRDGETSVQIAHAMGRSQAGVHYVIGQRGWVAPRESSPQSGWFLSLAEREEISRGLSRCESIRQIAARLGRSHTTVARDVARIGGRCGYRAVPAHTATGRRARRPKPAKLACNGRLRAEVERLLRLRWSPQ